jgi:type III secretion protein T
MTPDLAALADLPLWGGYQRLADAVLLLGLSTTRVAVAFLLVPLFTADLVPATVRNALFMALGMLGLLVQPPGVHAAALGGWEWALLFGKEAFIGGALGLLFAGMMWAFEAAGQIIDTKVGSSMAQVLDPLSGHQTSLTGAFLARLASWVFMAAGGFMLMAGALMESYGLWPVAAPWPGLQPLAASLFEAEFGRIMRLALLVAAPTLVLLYLIDGMLGLVNRFAQQLNVFSLSLSLKAVVAHAVLWMQLGLLVQLLAEDLLTRPAAVLQALRQLLLP